MGRSADVVVIGSGAGGGVTAKELAQAGYSVIVLEEGGYYTREDFDFRPARAFMRFYREAGQTITLGLPVVLLPQGKTVGGTTTINSGTCLRIHRHVLKRWHLESGLTELAETELNLLYAAVEEYLFVKRAERDVVGRNALLFLETAWRLGYSGGYLPRNAKDCEGYGVCAFGCPSGAKQSVNVSYIPDAVAAGADVYTHCRVDRIVTRGGRATGVRGHFVDPVSGRRRGAIEVEARVTVLAGGAIQSPNLLLRNRLCRGSGSWAPTSPSTPAPVPPPSWTRCWATPRASPSPPTWTSSPPTASCWRAAPSPPASSPSPCPGAGGATPGPWPATRAPASSGP